MAFPCIWMTGRRLTCNSEPVAMFIYGDMRAYLEMQPHTNEYLLARGSVGTNQSLLGELEFGMPSCRVTRLTVPSSPPDGCSKS
jgi:hypothetical protein